MTLVQQLMWGSLYLFACLLIETAILIWGMSYVGRVSRNLEHSKSRLLRSAVLLTTLAFILVAHTVQVWIWALAFVVTTALPDWNTAIYFSLVSYTSLGYGDVVLGPGLRIFGGFAAITGLLGFGISTGLLVAIMNRILSTSANFQGKNRED
ncbi:MAG: two pore domain potassium channel family protein [Rhodobacteraceae bacterium]|nr:two pore domain potassium channel family protein [Paracoccaceae bacterium]